MLTIEGLIAVISLVLTAFGLGYSIGRNSHLCHFVNTDLFVRNNFTVPVPNVLFAILSNAGLSADEIIKVARMRDCNEKSFRRMKDHFGLSKTYSHSAATYEGKMFVAFVALIVVEAYRYYIRPVLDAISSTTTRSTIGELNKYQIQQKHDGSWMLNRQRSVFPSDQALLKALYLSTFETTKKWTMPLRNWGRVYGELQIMYEGRLPE